MDTAKREKTEAMESATTDEQKARHKVTFRGSWNATYKKCVMAKVFIEDKFVTYHNCCDGYQDKPSKKISHCNGHDVVVRKPSQHFLSTHNVNHNCVSNKTDGASKNFYNHDYYENVTNGCHFCD